LSTNFQIPEFIRGYIGLIDTEVLQSVGIFLIFVMVIIALRRVRKLNDEVAELQGHVQQLLKNEQTRSLAEFRTLRQNFGKPDDGFVSNSAETALKLAVTEIELKGLRDMVTELRQARDDWKAQAGQLVLAAPPPITARAPADTPSAPVSAPTAAPEPERPTS
jgi:ascorbate-specific PTS system EIIC-type component UlaA